MPDPVDGGFDDPLHLRGDVGINDKVAELMTPLVRATGTSVPESPDQ